VMRAATCDVTNTRAGAAGNTAHPARGARGNLDDDRPGERGRAVMLCHDSVLSLWV
jgi:hypothetical protein